MTTTKEYMKMMSKSSDLIWSIEGYENLDYDKLKHCFMINSLGPEIPYIWKSPEDFDYLKGKHLKSIYPDDPNKPGGLVAVIWFSKDKTMVYYDIIPDSEPEHVLYYLRNKQKNPELCDTDKGDLK